MPAGYFDDDDLAARIDARITFVNSPGAQGMRVHGPCRVFPSEMTAGEIQQLYAALEQALAEGQAS